MPRAHGDCKFCDEWLVQDKYKEWVVKDGDPRIVDNIGIPTLNNNNKLESDSRLKAEILNNQFKSVFTHENVHLPQEPSTNIPPMPDIIITTEGVARLLHGLNPNKATT